MEIMYIYIFMDSCPFPHYRFRITICSPSLSTVDAAITIWLLVFHPSYSHVLRTSVPFVDGAMRKCGYGGAGSQ
jgi:hypothetical protein